MNLSRTSLQALGIESFVALSISRSGRRSESTFQELALVKLENGQVRDEIKYPLSNGVSQSLNIRNVLVSLWSELGDFIGNRLIVHAAHYSCSEETADEHTPTVNLSVAPRLLALGALGRIFLPHLSAFDIDSLAEHFEIQVARQQSLVQEAASAGLIFLELTSQAVSFDRNTLHVLYNLTKDLESDLAGFLANLHRFRQSIRESESRRVPLPPRNRIGKVNAGQENGNRAEIISPEEINRFFEEDGPLAACLPMFEKRPQQVAMARSVAVTFNQNEFLVAEAGTGVGKSFAYLLPALLWVVRESDRRVILATHTKTLQDQLFRKEIPLLYTMIEPSFSAILLKGRSNYVCLRRWEAMLDQANTALSVSQRLSLLPLVVWIATTQDGDIEGNAAFSLDRNRNIWQQIQSDEGFCLRSGCPHESRCFLAKARKLARIADVVVVNHALLLSDFLSDHAILGDFDTLILDEAHQFEKVSTQHLGSSLSLGHFTEILDEIHKEPSRNERFLDRLETAAAKISNGAEATDIRNLISHTRGLVETLKNDADLLFGRLLEHADGSRENNDAERKIRFGESPLKSCAGGETDRLIDALERLVQLLTRTLDLITGKTTQVTLQNQLELETMQTLDRLVGLRQRIEHFYSSDYQQNVVWCEISERAAKQGLRLFSVPLDVSELLGTQFYPGITRCVFTSATLTVGNEFHYIISRLGLDRLDPERLITRIFGSPFDYGEQVHMLIPVYLPSPKQQHFVRAVSGFVADILHLYRKGTLVLFTSYAMLKSVYAYIKNGYPELSESLFGQGIDGPRSALLKHFQETKTSVLFGTNSFWEGIDVPGEALEILVITKIPFDVPTEPVFQARYEYAEKRSGSGFMHYAVPEAIIRFRQGFGRLIRSGSDRGAILLLDRRVTSTNYGRVLLESLPVVPEYHDSKETLLLSLGKWFGQIVDPLLIPSHQDKENI